MRWCAILTAVLVLPVFLLAQEKDRKDDKAPSYVKEVKPILETNCAKCHSGAKAKGGFDVSSVESIGKGGKKSRDKALVSGKPDDSVMYKLVKETKMPPRNQKQRPTKEEIELLHKWIAEGAKDDAKKDK